MSLTYSKLNILSKKINKKEDKLWSKKHISFNCSSNLFIAHKCDAPGCSKVLVIDGSMKTCRQVCKVKDVTTLLFKSTEQIVLTGTHFFFNCIM